MFLETIMGRGGEHKMYGPLFMVSMRNRLLQSYQEHLNTGKIDPSVPPYGKPCYPDVQPHRLWLDRGTASDSLVYFSMISTAFKPQFRGDYFYYQTLQMANDGVANLIAVQPNSQSGMNEQFYELHLPAENSMFIDPIGINKLGLIKKLSCISTLNKIDRDSTIIDPPTFTDQIIFPHNIVHVAEVAEQVLQQGQSNIRYVHFLRQ
jgi:hypothetical protein